ncbi:MAG: 50S ribosomal protein L13 [bacterium]
MLQNTQLIKTADIKRTWHYIDASGLVLGRLATQIVSLLRGKGKRDFTPHIDNGDFVVVTNASKIRLTGNKAVQKLKFRHSGYPGGITLTPLGSFLKDTPEKAVRESVKGMLPKSKTRKRLLARLRVFREAEHTHQAHIQKGVA